MFMVDGSQDAAMALIPCDDTLPTTNCPGCNAAISDGTFVVRFFIFCDDAESGAMFMHVECIRSFLATTPETDYEKLRNEYLQVYPSMV